jgi:hypothetical protein
MIYDEHKTRALRKALDFPTGTSKSEHAAKVAALRVIHAHEIALCSEASLLTCVPYALGIAEEPRYEAIARDFSGEIFAGSDFVNWLLRGRLMEIGAPRPNCLALYFSDSSWKHMGVLIGQNRINSKWGTFPIYEHAFWEVPASYGDELRFFDAPENSLRAFIEYARTRADQRDIDDIVEEVARRDGI